MKNNRLINEYKGRVWVSGSLVSYALLFFLFFNFLLSTLSCHSQCGWINDNAKIQIKSGTWMVVPSDIINQNSGSFDNSGSINLYGNWMNNANNTALINSSHGTIVLLGDTQVIGGLYPTLFYNLTLQGTGVKKLAVNAMVEGELSLNDRELNTQNYSMSVLSADTSAIMRTSGYVSSIGLGSLARLTNAPLPYFFPVGSNNGIFRYRPVSVTPTSGNPNTFSVRMANVDATIDGYNRNITDGTVGNINDKFYHRINRISGSDSAKISIYYDNVADSAYFGMAHWDNVPAYEWENTNTATVVNNISPILSEIFINNWNNYTETPIALFNCIPSTAPTALVSDPNPGCVGEPHVLYVQGGSLGTGASWHWYDGSCGGTALGTSDSIIVYPAGTTTYFVRAEGTCGTTACISLLIKPDSPAPVSVTISSNDTMVCNGTGVTFTAIPVNEGVNPSFQWYLNGNSTGANSPGYSIANVNNNDSIYCVLISSALCISGNPANSDTIIMTVAPTYSVSSLVEICNGQSYNFGGTIYSSSGTYSHTFASATGCDSLVTLTLNVNPVYSVNNPQTICSGGSYVFNGHTYSTAGNYNDTLTTVNGCDSIIVTILTVNPTFNIPVNASICQGTTYVLPDNSTVSLAGSYSVTLHAINGCDSIVTTNLTVYPIYNNTFSATICNGQSYSFGGINYTTAGNYSHTFTSILGCDSIVTLTLIVTSTFNSTATATICNGQSYNFGGTDYTTTGNYNHTFTSISGCDSIVTLTLTVNPVPVILSAVEVCVGSSYVFNGHVYTTAGNYYDTLTTINGCDSVIITTLTVNPLPIAFAGADTSICNGQTVTLTATGGNTYLWDNGVINGIPFTPTGTAMYHVTVSDAHNCAAHDSVFVTINSESVAPTGITSSQNPVCSGSAINLSVNGGSLGSGASWIWSNGNCGNSQINTGSSISVTPNSTITYFVRAEGICNITNCVNLTINVNTNLPVSISISTLQTNICEGSLATFTAIPVNGGTPAFQWYIDGVAVANATDSIFSTTAVTNNNLITCNLTSSVVCATNNPAASNSINMLVTPTLIPSVSITSDPILPVCVGTLVGFHALPLNGGTNPSIQWFLNNNIVGNGLNYTPVNIASNDQIYCVMNSTLTCISSSSVQSGTLLVMFNILPVLSATQQAESCHDAGDASINLSITKGTPPYSVHWDNLSSSTTSITNLYSGTYNVTVTDDKLCSSDTSIFISPEGSGCLFIPNVFSPNSDGNNDILFVRGSNIKTLLLRIYDRWGNKIFESNNQNDGWDGTYNGTMLNAGVFVYYLKVELQNGNNTEQQGNITLIK